jgi:hypothetical protein
LLQYITNRLGSIRAQHNMSGGSTPASGLVADLRKITGQQRDSHRDSHRDNRDHDRGSQRPSPSAHSQAQAQVLQQDLRSTQEQLRLDHIETLEVLERTTKENKSLKLQVLTLQQQLAAATGTSTAAKPTDDDANAASAEEDSKDQVDMKFLVERIAAQDTEIKVRTAAGSEQ